MVRIPCNGAEEGVPGGFVCISELASESVMVIWYCRYTVWWSVRTYYSSIWVHEHTIPLQTPKRYAYTYFNRPHSFNKMPLSPLGCCPNPQKYWLQGTMGTTLCQWVVPWNFHQSLSLLTCMDQINGCHKSFIHRLLQAQLNQKYNCDAWRRCRACSTTTNIHSQRVITGSYGKKHNRPAQKMYAMFNMTADNFWQWYEEQHPQIRQKTPTYSMREMVTDLMGI